ncbi:hypothetical protein DK59_3001 [Brucella abortus bv. 4 str. 292]|nr:hypothetical protein DK59_3001 [Brucella abortus bv. 4 str. 292]
MAKIAVPVNQTQILCATQHLRLIVSPPSNLPRETTKMPGSIWLPGTYNLPGRFTSRSKITLLRARRRIARCRQCGKNRFRRNRTAVGDFLVCKINDNRRFGIKLAQGRSHRFRAAAAFHLGDGKLHHLLNSFQLDPHHAASHRGKVKRKNQTGRHGASQVSGTLFSRLRGDRVKEPVMISIGLNGGSSCMEGFVR